VSIVAKQTEPDLPVRVGSPVPVRKDAACVTSLRINLSNLVVFGFMAQGFHWNVTGRDFYQLHELFGEIYEDAFEAIDPMAEQIRTMGASAPFTLDEFQRLAMIDIVTAPIDASAMIRTLLTANDQVTAALNEAFAIATDINAQGIVDFLAGRIDRHQKWAWMLRESLG
jgi:starvation-inducible DNA-binding protein